MINTTKGEELDRIVKIMAETAPRVFAGVRPDAVGDEIAELVEESRIDLAHREIDHTMNAVGELASMFTKACVDYLGLSEYVKLAPHKLTSLDAEEYRQRVAEGSDRASAQH
jgi:hypothetical protein